MVRVGCCQLAEQETSQEWVIDEKTSILHVTSPNAGGDRWQVLRHAVIRLGPVRTPVFAV